MSYRKIEVNGKDYEYVIGKTSIKIKGIGVFPIDENSDKVGARCECCGEYYGETKTAVTPKHIKELILKNETVNSGGLKK
jgi:uncharacterized hydantoinase/oxoprolinase family protein